MDYREREDTAEDRADKLIALCPTPLVNRDSGGSPGSQCRNGSGGWKWGKPGIGLPTSTFSQ